MKVWMFIWQVVFVVGVGLFAGMAVWVSIGGARDIKKLLAKIEGDHSGDPETEG